MANSATIFSSGSKVFAYGIIFCEKTEKLLMAACLGYLGDLFGSVSLRPVTLAQTSQIYAQSRAKCRLSLPPKDVFARQL